MKSLQYYFSRKLGSRKFQIVLAATILYIFIEKFNTDSLLFVYAVYMGLNVLDKYLQAKNGGSN